MYKVLSVVAKLDSNPSSTRVFVRSLGIPPPTRGEGRIRIHLLTVVSIISFAMI